MPLDNYRTYIQYGTTAYRCTAYPALEWSRSLRLCVKGHIDVSDNELPSLPMGQFPHFIPFLWVFC